MTSTNNNVGTNELECLPVFYATGQNEAKSDLPKRLSTLAVSMLSLYATLSSIKSEAIRELIKRQVDATDREIDQLVYELYGLTEEEIKIVENAGL